MSVDLNKIAICFTCDENYLQHFTVALTSFLTNNPGDYHVFLLTDAISKENILKVEENMTRFSPRSKFGVLKIEDNQKVTDSKMWMDHIGIETYFRLLIPDLVPENFDYALYFDADVIIHGELDFGVLKNDNYSIYAVLDPTSHNVSPKRNLKKYFNAGVLIFNLKKYREKYTRGSLSQHRPKIMRYADQDILNDFFRDDWYELEDTHNVLSHRMKYRGFKLVTQKLKKQPVVIHYMGCLKPWKYWVKGSALYWYYCAKTNYKSELIRIPITIIKSLLHLLRVNRK